MAKNEAKKTEGKATESKEAKKGPPQPEKPKYGVPELAAALDVKPASVRVQLRKAGIKKNGKVYGWNSKDEMQAVVNKLKATKTERKAKESDDGDEDGDDDDEE